MSETLNSLNEKILILQNALITQRIDQVKLQSDMDNFSERSSFYENLYNKTRNELYDLEIEYKNILMENQDLKKKYSYFVSQEDMCEHKVFDKTNIKNLSSIELIKILLKRLKVKMLRGEA